MDSKIGSFAGDFDGIDDYVRIAHSTDFEFTDFSHCSWARKTNSDYARIFSKQNSWIIGVNAAERVFWLHNLTAFNTTNLTDTTIRLNTWNHYCMVRDTSNDQISIYLNGRLIDSAVSADDSTELNTNLISIGSHHEGPAQFFSGQVDDVALWAHALNPSEIALIYHRQKQKYSGTYTSPVLDLGASGPWTSFSTSTPLPFGKELTGPANEDTDNYTQLSGDLSESLIGYWDFNEVTADTAPDVGAGVTDFADKSGSDNHANDNNGSSYEQLGILQNAVLLNGGQFVSIPHSTDFDFGTGTDFTVSGWVKSADTDGIFVTSNSDGGGSNFTIFTEHSSTGRARAFLYDGSQYCTIDSSRSISDGKWHHLAFVFYRSSTCTASDFGIYIDGVLDSSATINNVSAGRTDFNLNNSHDLWIGRRFSGDNYLSGAIDEIALWSRALTTIEIGQLYQRGANRIKYQVKSCVDSNCNCVSLNVSPAGSSNDCDGDGTPNDQDLDDNLIASFKGPGGDGSTFYSELVNRDPADLAFNCALNSQDSDANICVQNELSLSGTTTASAPSFEFSDFPGSSQPTDNRFFQVRVLMEAEENETCDGDICLPEMTALSISPTDRYYAGSPELTSLVPINIGDETSQIAVEASSTCDLSYQLSPNGSDFYHWDGSVWAIGSGAQDSNSLSDLNGSLANFVEQLGADSLYFRAYLGSSNFQPCSMESLYLQTDP